MKAKWVHLCSMQWVIKDGKVAAVDWGFNVYGGTQKENGDWYSKWGLLYATELKDARCCKPCFQLSYEDWHEGHQVVMHGMALIAFKLFGSQIALPDAADHHVTCNRKSTVSLTVPYTAQIWVAVFYTLTQGLSVLD